MNAQKTDRGVVWLQDLTRADAGTVGAKAATLGELLRAGFPVPDGFAVVGDADEEAVLAAGTLGDVPLAVRSSGLAEDLPDASFAGQYETVLGVRGERELRAAIRRCQESAAADRVEQYRRARTGAGEARMAVLVQRMIAPEAAGVAFTANPLTGNRDEVVITASAGLGERVVGGEAVGDEWVVRGGAAASSTRSVEGVIDAGRAAAIARLARRAAAHLGGPQDVEWALAGGELHLLQARPMTALPEPAEWRPPSPGYWMRNFRLGEWLPEPMTPLFQDWLLELIEEGYLDGMRHTLGTRVAFRHAAVNGWYYTATPHVSPPVLLRVLREGRGRVVRFLFRGLVRIGARPELADRTVLRALAEEWRDELLPRYRGLVAGGERRVAGAGRDDLAALVDEVGRMAGRYLWSLAVVGGSAWKMEGALAGFCRKRLSGGELGDGAQVLLAGLPGAEPEAHAHLVQSADWYHATAGELGLQDTTASPRARAGLVSERERAEAACRAALAPDAKLLARFETLLEVAQRYAIIREQQARMFTLGWPLLRRCALGLGDDLRERGVIDRPEDVFFLTRAEMEARTSLRETIATRRAEWERRGRLVAPLAIGRAPRLMRRALDGAVDAVRSGRRQPEGALVGEPASPGRASGRARIVRGPDDFERFEAGEVLVARGTAPAWTPLFARAAAVVTDGGSLAAHASLVAREYGIPAVVGTGDATARLHDGQLVIVDGSAGVVMTG